ncbi:MAG: RnfABCDGE type electron transport complex subunit B [Thermoguttaceae bacterium]|nr:RnfABCDGE type electron transport complex subunit B [Thermoguttaceae bacterium]
MTTVYVIIISVIVLLTLAIVLSWILGWANVAFAVEVDPKEEKILSILPGANCGACGYAGCADLAKNLAQGNGSANQCTQCGTAQVTQIAQIMGVEAGDVVPQRAVVHCSGDCDTKLQMQNYVGEKTCAAANLVSGVQGCAYGCLGFGDCMRACKYGAIQIVNGMSHIDYDKCRGCRACEAACPRHIISMVPFKNGKMLVIACSNHDIGPEVKAVCKTGCIGCSGCVRRDAEDFQFDNGLPVINYNSYHLDAMQEAAEKCPSKIMKFVGQESANTHVEVVTDAFKSDVDETEWRG